MKKLLLAAVMAVFYSNVSAQDASLFSGQSDWSGFYTGGMYNFENGKQLPFSIWQIIDGEKQELFAGNITLKNKNTYGAFAGYNFQSGSFVYGAELAYTLGGAELEFGEENKFNYTADLKARVGYNFGSFLVYGVVGGSMSEMQISDVFMEKDKVQYTGFNYGAGLEYLFSKNAFIGAEYLVRDMSGTYDLNEIFLEPVGYDFNYINQSVQIRVGWKF